MPSSTPDIFTRQQVSRLCKPAVLTRMHRALMDKPSATVGELVALSEAIEFGRKWHGGDPMVFFTFEETAKHCNAVLNIAERHFISNPR